MAREQLLINELQQNWVPQHATVHTTSNDALQDIFLRALREMFARHPEYTYVSDPERGFGWPDFDKTKITIWEDYPLDTMFLPNITTAVGSLRDHPMSFNQDRQVVKYLYDDNGTLAHDSYGHPIPIYYEYASAWDGTFNIAVNTGSPVERDVLTDFVKISMMHLWRDWLYMRGVHVKTVSAGGSEIREWKSDKIYRTVVTVEIYSEWNHRIPIPGGNELQRISYQIGTPISHSIFTPQGYVLDGPSVGSDGIPAYNAAPRSQVQNDQFLLNLRPSSAIDTLEYNLATNAYEITEEWWLKIAQHFDEQVLAQKYGITKLSDITVSMWMDILASVSSPARMGYPKVIFDLTAALETAATAMGVSPSDDLSGHSAPYNRVRELQSLVAALTATYHTDVTRYGIAP
jgi:hypothetical protein